MRLRWLLPIILSMQATASEPLSVCEILRSPKRFDGQTIVIRGRYFANRHGASFGCDACGESTPSPFAVADWTGYRGASPNLDSITRYREPLGKPSTIDGEITAQVRVKAVRNFRAKPDPKTGEEFGNGEGYNGWVRQGFSFSQSRASSIPSQPVGYARRINGRARPWTCATLAALWISTRTRLWRFEGYSFPAVTARPWRASSVNRQPDCRG